MKKCQKCGYKNTDIMNYCLECGNPLADEPQMVVPLDTIYNSEPHKTEQFTEVYEGETVVNNRFAIQQSVPTFQNQVPPTKSSSNAKIFLAIGGVFLGLIFLIGGGAVGIFIYALNSDGGRSTPNRPLVSKTPIKDSEFPTPTPEEIDFPLPEKSPKSTPKPKKTPSTDEEPITFPTPQVATKRGNYTVKSLNGWQISHIKTVRSQNFRVRGSGRIKLNGIKKRVGVKGINGYEDRRILKQYKTGALLMRTHYPDGRHSNIQPVGSGEYWQNAPDETGKIEFLINDNQADSNSGSFKIKYEDMGVAKNS